MKTVFDIIWSDEALNDVELAKTYYSKEDGEILVKKFLNEAKQKTIQLYDFPHLGRTGEVFGTKELVLQKFPYKVVYKLQDTKLYIIAFIHQKELYPKG